MINHNQKFCDDIHITHAQVHKTRRNKKRSNWNKNVYDSLKEEEKTHNET